MGRPLPKKFFGSLALAGEQIQATAWTTSGGSALTGYVVHQKGTSRYMAHTADGESICKLVDGPTAVDAVGLMSIAIYGSGAIAGADATASPVMEDATTAVAAGGTNYLVGDTVTVTGGTGTKITHTVATINTATGAVLTLSAPTNRGAYTVLPAVTGAATTSNGTGTSLTVNLTFRVKSVTVTAGGHDYDAPPTVAIGGNATLGTPTVSGGAVTAIPVTAAGSAYTTIPSVTITSADTGTVEYAKKITRHRVVTFAGNVYQWALQDGRFVTGQAAIESA